MNIKKKTNRITLTDISRDLAKLNQKVDDGFKQVNARIDNLEKDVNSLKQDVGNINARLDYNGLKQLPNRK